MSDLPLLANSLRLKGFRGGWRDLTTIELPRKCAVLANSHFEAAHALRSHLADPGEMLLAPAARVDHGLLEQLRAAGFHIVSGLGLKGATVEAPTGGEVASEGKLWLLTSGTSGRPKMVAHTLDSLATVPSPQPKRKWLCAYAPGSYAWWQVVTLPVAHAGIDIVFVDEDELGTWPEVAASEGVDAVSGTPTFWRHALWSMSIGLRQLRLTQVSLGGEPIDQALLDNLRQLFPEARITWIYASSEAGAAIAVHDGLAGFPVAWLDRKEAGRPTLSVVKEELVITSEKAARNQPARIHTGDRVEIRDDRAHIIGRLGSDEVNVGGTKVSSGHVRNVILRHPSVRWASVRGRRAPIVGQVVVADVVVDGPLDVGELRSWCSIHLPDQGVPRRINLLPEIPLRGSLKSDV